MNGVIKKVITDKGFGFISREGEKDVYFSKGQNEAIFGTLKEGDNVTFELGQGEKGPFATNVALAA